MLHLLPIADGVVVMPLIGSLEAQRVEQVMETLLAGIVAHKASQVILDVTASPAGGVAVSTRVTYPDGSASSAPAVSLSTAPAVLFARLSSQTAAVDHSATVCRVRLVA